MVCRTVYMFACGAAIPHEIESGLVTTCSPRAGGDL